MEWPTVADLDGLSGEGFCVMVNNKRRRVRTRTKELEGGGFISADGRWLYARCWSMPVAPGGGCVCGRGRGRGRGRASLTESVYLL